VRADGSRRAAADAPTAKQAFVHLMRDRVAPALRELGFIGSLTRGYFIASGDYKGGFSTQPSVSLRATPYRRENGGWCRP
jgi:hypothetical protein